MSDMLDPADPPSPDAGLRAALEGLNAPLAWLTEHYPKAMAEMPTDLFRAFDRARAALASSPAPAGLTLLEDVAVQPDDGPRDGLNKGTLVYLAPAPAGLDVDDVAEVLLMHDVNEGRYETARAIVSRAATRPAEPNHRHPGGDNATCPACAATRPAPAGLDVTCSAIWNGCRCARKPHEGDGHVWRNTLDGELVCPHHPQGCSLLEDGEPSVE